MQLCKIEAIIESILFTMGEAVELDKIADVIEQDKNTTKKIMNNLIDKYDSPDRGITIIEIDNAYQMCTKTEYYDYIRKVNNKAKNYVLTDVLLETLSIIAYKQPITKAEVEKIRGVSSVHCINKLIDYNLVCEKGRMDAPGRPIIFGTTQDFLRNFGFQSLKELPLIEEEKLSTIQIEAQEEVQKEFKTEEE
ncbi:SMC-Scp complex subunit ScpB [Vallitalea guaymasensis]|uniref:Segregation and condensation protein B n=1 Tax=Vallitalea guaymasensis TaxID=1185412 RepID=A0A8J8MFP3_9FIRM|nr:SMC-Scp complex subunit ScpB [Vallitalea guaymasensis]QUH31785.1 SMC-Scp complex subunit ScpB [Vallitalea guaymasensis]